MQVPELKNTFPFRVLVDITFHYNKSKLRHLFQVIKTFFEYPIESIDIVIITNTADGDKLRAITSLCSPLAERNPGYAAGVKTLTVESFPDLVDPWHLPWCHKHLIEERFLDVSNGYSHYIHTEDDVVVSFDSFCYFVTFREILQQHGLIPSFLNSNLTRLKIVCI